MFFSGKKFHSFHLVSPSPWPIITAGAAFFLAISLVLFMHGFLGGIYFLFFSVFFLSFCLFNWWRDVIWEATFEGYHTNSVQRGLRLGFMLFILSEVIFFFAFFWAFFHSSLSPAVQLGCVWPPVGLVPFNPWGVPLLNTYILLLSGATITATHYYLIGGEKSLTSQYFIFTIILALLFTLIQLFEYKESSFSINDGIYGSTFFMTTGFHGLHVIIGITFIVVCWFRFLRNHFSFFHHLGFEAAAWYWHFVDVVWLFLFVAIYWWGGA
jgi:cytochrome c oxidase subunit 3